MSKAQILVVEDEPVVAIDLQQALELEGFHVSGVAENAEEALIAAGKQTPDLALLDINIAGSMDGIQTAKILRHWFNIPVVFVTAFSDDETVARASQQMAYGYLTKPIRARELSATVRIALAKAQQEAKLRDEHIDMITAMDCTRDGFLLTSMDGRVRYMNATIEMLTGLRLKDAVGRPIGELLHLSDESGCEIRSLAGFSTGSADVFGWKLKSITGDERVVDLSISVANDVEERPRGMVITCRNAEPRLKHACGADTFSGQAAFDSSNMALAVLDSAGNIQRVNSALVNVMGVQAEMLVGRSYASITSDSQV